MGDPTPASGARRTAVRRAMLACYGLDHPGRDPGLEPAARVALELTGGAAAAIEVRPTDGSRLVKACIGLAQEGSPELRVPICDVDGIELAEFVVKGVGRNELRVGARASLVDLAALVAELLRHRWGGRDVPGVALVTGDGTLAGATPALERLLGRSSADWVGMSVFDLIHPDDLHDAVGAFARSLEAQGAKAPLDLRLGNADGGWCPVEITAENQLDDPGAGVITVVVRDLSDRGRGDARVAAEVRLVGLLARGVGLPELFAALAVEVEAAVPGSTCCIQVVEGASLRTTVARSLPPELVAITDGAGIGPAGSPWGTSAAANAGHVTPDLRTDPAWDGFREPWLAHGIQSWWSSAIRGQRDREVLGLINLFARRPGRPLSDQVRLVDVYANFAAVAIQRTAADAVLAHAATHDALTGLPNRVLFLESLECALQRRRSGGGGVAVLFVDLDHFKVVNDAHGHGAGDRMLEGIARRFDSLRAEGEVVARFGGDEFTILCTGVVDEAAALAVAARYAEGLGVPLRVGDVEVPAQASLGVVLARDGEEPEDLLRDADAAMYRAKERGRNRVEVFDDAMRARAVRRLETERALHRALRHDEVELHYQPEWEVTTGRLVGVEALARWRHPERGLLGPDAFVPLPRSQASSPRSGRSCSSGRVDRRSPGRRSGSTRSCGSTSPPASSPPPTSSTRSPARSPAPVRRRRGSAWR